MEMKKVESSNIQEVGYDPSTSALRIRFKSSGMLYEYINVPQEAADRLLNADSVGSHFHQHIKSAHQARKIVEPEPSEVSETPEAANDEVSETSADTDKKKRASKKASKKRKGKRNGDEDGETGSL